MSNYLGDIGGKEKTRRDFVADMKMAKTRWNIGTFGRYKLMPKISVKLAFDYLRIEGDDRLSSNPGRKARNLNFKNDLFDGSLTFNYFFFEDNDLGNTTQCKNGFRAYVFAGIGGFYSNPQAYYYGTWIPLQPLRTEGVSYKKFGAAIPLGIGFYFTHDRIHRFGFEINYRKTFSDYLDDISGNYPADKGLSGNPILSLRAGELESVIGSDVYEASMSHTWGEKRGDNTHKDAYVTMSISYSYVLLGRISFYKNSVNDFFGGKKKAKVRKIRARF